MRALIRRILTGHSGAGKRHADIDRCMVSVHAAAVKHNEVRRFEMCVLSLCVVYIQEHGRVY